MPSRDELYQALRNADASGDAEGAQKLASYIQSMPSEDRTTKAATQLAEDRKAYDPTVGMSGTDKFFAGMGKAVVDAKRGITGLLGADNKAEIEESRRLDAPLMSTGAGVTGDIGGNVLMTLLPGGALKGVGTLAKAGGAARAGNALQAVGQSAMAPTSLRGAATLGAVAGATQPALDTGERLTNTGLGGVLGAGGQAGVNALSRIVRPNTSAAVRGLIDEGITPTPGQILGGGFKRAEEALTSVPIVGDAIKGAQGRAAGDLNRAAFNRALDPIGEKLPKGVVGREAVEFTEGRLKDRYEALMPKLTTQADGQFIQDVQALRNSMGQGAIDPAMAQRFESILNNQVLAKFQGPNTTLTGETLKQVEGDLGNLWRQFRASPDPDQRLLGDAIRETQDILRRTVERSNPQAADELKAINTGYANFKRVQRASAGVAAEDGVFSPAQLQSAVKAADKSKDKGAFARGDALMQDLAEPARAVLGSKVPDSGTPFRTLTALGAGGAAGGLMGPGTAAAVLAGPALYSRPGQSALAALLARRPDSAEPVANALRRLAPYAPVPLIASNPRQ